MASKVKLKPSNQSLSARGLPVRPPVIKKKVTRKKKVANPVRNQVDELLDKQLSFENGLDRCASLLTAMLETPSDGNVAKPHKKRTLSNRRVISSTPVDNFDSKSMKLPTAVSQIVDSGQVSDANTIDELIEEKELLQQYLNKIVHRSTVIKRQVKHAAKDGLSDIDQNSDATRDNDKPAENNSLENTVCNQNTFSINNGSAASAEMDTTLTNYNVNDCEYPMVNNGTTNINRNNDNRKIESDQSELFEILESITSKLRVDDDVYNSDNCGKNIDNDIENSGVISQRQNIHAPEGACSGLINSIVQNSVDNTTDEVQSFSRDKTLTNSSLHDNHMLFENVDGVTPAVEDDGKGNYCIGAHNSGNQMSCQNITNHEEDINDRYDEIFKEYRDNLPSYLLVSLGRASAESCGDSLSDSSVPSRATPITDNSKLNMRPKAKPLDHPKLSGEDVSNISLCQEQAVTQLTMLDCLIKELRSKLLNQWNIELDQLFAEIEHVIGSLPFLVNTTYDAQADINNALHPLEVENADLKRKSFLLSEKVEDLNQTIDKLSKSDTRSEAASVDLIIKTVQNKLGSEQRLKNEMSTELIDLQRMNEELKEEKNSLVYSKNEISTGLLVLQRMNEELKKENNSLVHSINENELKELEEREKYLKEASSKKHEIALLQTHISELQLQKQADEKEKCILDLSLRQRDYEIDRLSKLNTGLQESVSKLLADISNVKRRPDRQSKYNTSMLSNDVSPSHNNFTPKKVRSPTKYTTDQPTSTEYKKHSSSSRVALPPNNVTSILLETHSNRKYLDSESENDNLSTIVSNISENSATTALLLKSKMSTLSETDFSLWSLATYDGAEFQRNIEHLDAEIQRIQSSMKRSNIS